MKRFRVYVDLDARGMVTVDVWARNAVEARTVAEFDSPGEVTCVEEAPVYMRGERWVTT